MFREGKFFKIDPESDFSKGKVRFRYLEIKNKKENYYPVYLVIDKYSIDFFFHGITPNKTHINQRIIHFPLSLNLAVKDNLTYTLVEYCEKSIKVNGDEYKGHENVFVKDKSGYSTLEIFMNITSEVDTNEAKNKSPKEISFYFPLTKIILDFIYDLEHNDIFSTSPYTEEAEVHLKENYYFSSISAKAAYYYYRERYSSINKKLNEPSRKDTKQNDPQKQQNNEKEENEKKHEESDDLIEQRLNHYSNKLQSAEKQWLNIIRDLKAEELFGLSGWVAEIELEYDRVLFPQVFKYKKSRYAIFEWIGSIFAFFISLFYPNVKYFSRMEWRSGASYYRDENNRILKESAKWYLRRYSILKALNVILQTNRFLIIAFWFSIIFVPLIFLILPENDFCSSKCLSVILIPFSIIIIFSILILLLSWFSKKFEGIGLAFISALMPRLIMAITSAWIVFSTTEELIKTSFDEKIFGNGWIFLLFIPVLIFMAIEIRNLAPKIHGFAVFRRIILISIISFVYSIVIGIFSTQISTRGMLERSGYLNQFILDNIVYTVSDDEESNFKFDLETQAAAIGLLDEDNFIVNGFFLKQIDYLDNANLLLKLRTNSQSEISTVSISNVDVVNHSFQTLRYLLDYFNPESTQDTAQYLKFHELYADKAAFFYFINDTLNTNLVKILCNPHEINIYDGLTNVTYKSILCHNTKLRYKPKFLGRTLDIFPGMLFTRAIFAMFIGIFIQLIFEDKPITEPL